jgi:hypothetical protein
MPESPPAPLSRPSIFQKEKYPTEDKSSEKLEITGKLGEIFIWFGMRELARDTAVGGVDGLTGTEQLSGVGGVSWPGWEDRSIWMGRGVIDGGKGVLQYRSGI